MANINIKTKNNKSAKDIAKLLKAINKNSISDTVAIAALDVYSEVTKIENVTISHCTFEGK